MGDALSVLSYLQLTTTLYPSLARRCFMTLFEIRLQRIGFEIRIQHAVS